MALSETIALVRITNQSWQSGKIYGEIEAGSYQWQFEWQFLQGKLSVKPTLGRSLIQEPLARFLEHCDYQLEVGGDYHFAVRAKL
ncbi:MAG: DUF3146 family protein [Cyanobacterium sp.]